MRTRIALMLAGLVLPPMTGLRSATIWPGLRGPSYDGAVREARLFAGETGGLTIGWQRQLGSGYSVVTADAKRLVAAFQSGNEDWVAAFDLEHGDEIWRHAIGAAYAGHSGSHDGPIATPVLADDRVYGLGPRGDLYALDAGNGDILWKLNLVERHEAEIPYYGFASSPLIVDGVLVVGLGAGEGRAFAGFDAQSGELLWTAGTDSVRYQSPILTEIHGELQVLAVGNKALFSLDPATGEVLWSHEHNGDERDMGGNTIVPVPAGEGRILLMNTHPTSVMLQVTRSSPYEITELWSSGSIKSSYVQPVYHDGYLYGMNSKIFTCVDAATGETVWRSREAGDGFPTLVGDHLVIMNKSGTVRVAEATPEGYREVASLEVFEDHSWSAPAFADGRLFLRSMGQLARIDPVSTQADDADSTAWVAGTGFGQFLAQVEAAQDKAALIDDFLAQQPSFPIVEEDGSVHFIYRGEAQDVGIVGDMIGYRREDPMIPLAGTDLFYYSTRLEPDAAVTYGFIVDFSDPLPDPLNPVPGEGLFGPVSFMAMPAWRAPEFLVDVEPARRGELETVEWQSEVKQGESRRAEVYLPAGYDADSDRSYPTIYVLDGSEASKHARLISGLDNLIGDAVEPVIVVLVGLDPENPRRDLGDLELFSKMVATELVPLIDERFRTRAEPTQRAVVGAAAAGDAAFISAVTFPELYRRVGMLWPIFFDHDASQLPTFEDQPMVIYHAWGTYHIRSPHEAWDQVVENRAIFQAFRDAGYRPAGGEVPEGFGWANWRGYTDDMLRALFPAR